MALTIRFEGPDDAKFHCSVGTLKAAACGGKPPYVWSITAGSIDHLTGYFTTITPPSNIGSGEAGVAYQFDCYLCSLCSGGGGSGPDCSSVIRNNTGLFACDGTLISCGASSGSCRTAPPASDLNDNCPPPGTANPGAICPDIAINGCVGLGGGVLVGPCDKRTAPMIAALCKPCVIAMDSAVLTVTDSLGASVARTLIGRG